MFHNFWTKLSEFKEFLYQNLKFSGSIVLGSCTIKSMFFRSHRRLINKKTDEDEMSSKWDWKDSRRLSDVARVPVTCNRYASPLLNKPYLPEKSTHVPVFARSQFITLVHSSRIRDPAASWAVPPPASRDHTLIRRVIPHCCCRYSSTDRARSSRWAWSPRTQESAPRRWYRHARTLRGPQRQQRRPASLPQARQERFSSRELFSQSESQQTGCGVRSGDEGICRVCSMPTATLGIVMRLKGKSPDSQLPAHLIKAKDRLSGSLMVKDVLFARHLKQHKDKPISVSWNISTVRLP